MRLLWFAPVEVMGTGRGGGGNWLGVAVLLSLALIACEDEPAAQPPYDAQGPSPPPDAAITRPLDAGKDASRPVDSGTRDSALIDAARDDGAAPDAVIDAALPAPTVPTMLADTGLFAPGSTSQLAPGVRAYAPRYALWADGAEKERWFYLPEDTQIDSSDMDYWTFPIGTKAWKLFTRDGKKLETRLLWKTEAGWLRAAYAWNDAESEAVLTPKGAENVRGTEHDIPNRTACNTCHEGLPDRLLGVSAIQLSHSGSGMTLSSLIAEGKLSAPPASDFARPDDAEWNALGYLHANCGHCHNPKSGEVYGKVDLDLWLRTSQLNAVSTTASYATTVGQMLTDTASANTLRIAAGAPGMSGLIERMELRGADEQMPPLASERVDVTGTGAVRAWIADL